MTSGSRFDLPLATILVTAGAWTLLTALLLGAGWLTFRGCGLALPDGRALVEWCSVQTRTDELAALESRRTALKNEINALERGVRDMPPCTDNCIFAGDEKAVDVYILLDASSSFADDLPNLIAAVEELAQRAGSGRLPAQLHVGVGSFTDKPIAPHGLPGVDFTFRAAAPVSGNFDAAAQAVRALVLGHGGATAEEAQLEAMVEVMGRIEELGFRPDSRRFLVVVTDAPAHEQGALAGARHPEDGQADGNPLDEDYPSRAQVGSLLAATGTTPLFLAAGAEAQSYYRELRETLGRGLVIPATSDSSGMLDALFEGIFGACMASGARGRAA